MRIVWLMCITLGLSFTVGCVPVDQSTSSSVSSATAQPFLSMNKRVALASSGAEMATVAALDAVALSNYDATRAKTIEVATALMRFVEAGSCADLPLSAIGTELKKALVAKNFGDYTYMVDTLMSTISMMSVDTSKVGPNNVLIIKQGLQGIIDGATLSKKEWRSDVMPAARSITVK